MLARDYGVAHVTGIGIEPELMARATMSVGAVGLQSHGSVRQVEPGPLLLDEHSFDLVMTKDAIYHMLDKAAVFVDVFRS